MTGIGVRTSSTPTGLANSPGWGKSYDPMVAVDGAGTLYVAWWNYSIFYRYKPANAPWSSWFLVASGWDPAIAGDPISGVHLAWIGYDERVHYEKR